MLKKLNKSNQGFTIVEVVIVLAIAGLIMLIVFLAVPALQRSQRNTARKSDAGRIGAVATEWMSNHNGAAPVVADQAAFRLAVGTMSFYAAGNLTVAIGNQAAINNTDNIRLTTSAVCDAANPGETNPGNQRQMAVQWLPEPGGAGTAVCQNV